MPTYNTFEAPQTMREYINGVEKELKRQIKQIDDCHLSNVQIDRDSAHEIIVVLKHLYDISFTMFNVCHSFEQKYMCIRCRFAEECFRARQFSRQGEKDQ